LLTSNSCRARSSDIEIRLILCVPGNIIESIYPRQGRQKFGLKAMDILEFKSGCSHNLNRGKLKGDAEFDTR
jgi:hypothetical protein